MPQNQQNRDIVVAALRHAAPYVRLYRRKTFVIKAGGEVFADAKSTRALIEVSAKRGRRASRGRTLRMGSMGDGSIPCGAAVSRFTVRLPTPSPQGASADLHPA